MKKKLTRFHFTEADIRCYRLFYPSFISVFFYYLLEFTDYKVHRSHELDDYSVRLLLEMATEEVRSYYEEAWDRSQNFSDQVSILSGVSSIVY